MATLLALSAAMPLSAQYPTPEQSRAEFEAMCRRVHESDNPYFGDLPMHQLEARLKQETSPGPRRDADLARYGYELIRVGEAERAVTMLERRLAELGAESLDSAGVSMLLVAAVGRLQLAEDTNCITLHDQASCILPLRPGAIHRDPEHARAATALFRRALDAGDDRFETRWLLNLSLLIAGDGLAALPERWRLPEDAFAAATGGGLWLDVASRLGVNVLDNAGGAVMDDFDGDGLLDLVSSSWDPCAPMKAFRNDGNGGFEEVTSAWGLDGQLGGLNLVHADYDDDGMLDLLVLRGAWFGSSGRMRNSLLRNDLRRDAGRFVDVTAASGLAYPAYPTQTAAWADYDLDGDLDLFVGNEAAEANADPQALDPLAPRGYPSQLFRNEGDGRFREVTREAGIDDRGYTKGVAWGDYDDDGDPDLYLSNLGPNRLYRNEGDGRFRDVTAEAGVDGSGRRTFPTWFFDFDDDGDLDLFVGPYNVRPRVIVARFFGLEVAERAFPGEVESTLPLLYRNDGGRFVDVARGAGLLEPALAMGANYGDLDGDGRLDLYLGTGTPDPEALMPNLAFRNTGNGFEHVTYALGLGHLQKGHGVAFGDVDNDGREELFHQLGGAYPFDSYTNALFLPPTREGRWVVLRLRGTASNRFALGARLRVDFVERGQPRAVHRLVSSGGSFGGSSLQQEIGLGDADHIERVEVRWPSGERSRYLRLELDRFYELVEGDDAPRELDLPRIRLDLRPSATHDHANHGPGSR